MFNPERSMFDYCRFWPDIPSLAPKDCQVLTYCCQFRRLCQRNIPRNNSEMLAAIMQTGFNLSHCHTSGEGGKLCSPHHNPFGRKAFRS
jgi:hypothetical protein